MLSGPFSYAGRRALARIQALQPEIRELKAKHGDDSHALQRDLLELYRQQSINPWSPLLGFIPAVIEIGLIVLVYVAVGIPSALLAPAILGDSKRPGPPHRSNDGPGLGASTLAGP
jgi:membrane protein insertase Oxa1/YidC/SpoIIIJ